MDIAGTLSAITAALGLVKELREVDHQIDKADLKLKLAEVTSALADAKLGIVDTQDIIAAKDKEIGALKASFAAHGALVEYNGFRFFADESGNPKGFAICPRCERVDGFLMQLVRDNDAKMHGSKCPKCRATYDGRESRA